MLVYQDQIVKKIKKNVIAQIMKQIKNLLIILKNKKIKFIFLSTSHVYKSSNKKINENFEKKPSNIYGKYKLKSENYIRKHLKDFLILRVFNIYGPNQPKGIFFQICKKK